MSHRILALTLGACLLTTAATAREEPAIDPRDAEIIDRILVLQRQIDELMALLSPALREEVRRRLAEPAGEKTDPSPTVAEPTRAAPEPTPARPVVASIAAEPEAKTTPETLAAAEPPVPEPETPKPAAAIAPSSPATTSPLPRRISRRKQCNTLEQFDENGDGKVNAADRNWRHLYLWTDRNADRQMQDREVESAYDRGVREISVSLETYLRTKGNLGELRIEDQVVLDLRGDGFAERSRRDDGVLLVDATALRRGQGLKLLGPAGEVLDGFQAFRSGLRIADPAGTVTELDCP